MNVMIFLDMICRTYGALYCFFITLQTNASGYKY